jgi:hypothetical protein
MVRIFQLTLVGTALALGLAACDRDHSQSPDYFKIASLSVQPLAETLDGQEPTAPPVDDCRPSRLQGGLGDALDPLNAVIAVGEKVWKLIEAGRPVVSFKAPVVHALPFEKICWHQLQGWQPPQSAKWEVRYKNKLGMDVVRFTYRISYAAGGKLETKGRYLANVTVTPAELSVKWGFEFGAEAQVGRALNLGTSEDPLAGLQLMVNWNIKSRIAEELRSQSYFVSGDGTLKAY